MIRSFIQITSLSFTVLAALFLAKGNFGLSAETIAELAGTWFHHNAAVVKSLARQRADTWVGVIFLLAAFALQMWNALWPMTLGDLDTHRGAAGYAIVFSAVIAFGAYFLAVEVAANTEARSEQILAAPPAKPPATPPKAPHQAQ